MSNWIYYIEQKTVEAKNPLTGEVVKIGLAKMSGNYPRYEEFEKTRLKNKIARLENWVETNDVTLVTFSNKLRTLQNGSPVYRCNGNAFWCDTPDYNNEGAIGWVSKKDGNWLYQPLKGKTVEERSVELRPFYKESSNYSNY